MRITRLVVALSVLVVLAGGCSGGDAATTTTAAAVSTTTTGYTEDELARIAEVEDRARAYVAAVNEGRTEDMAEIVGVTLGESDVRHFEFHAILNASGIQWNLGECEVASVSSSMVGIECEHSYNEPVFVAAGAGESIWPFMLIGDWLKADSWIPLGNDFTDALAAYRDHLKGFHPADYALCDPLEQTGDFSQHGGMARVPECAPVMIEHSDAVIEWIEAGKPTG
jgi:hypothetical protein